MLPSVAYIKLRVCHCSSAWQRDWASVNNVITRYSYNTDTGHHNRQRTAQVTGIMKRELLLRIILLGTLGHRKNPVAALRSGFLDTRSFQSHVFLASLKPCLPVQHGHILIEPHGKSVFTKNKEGPNRHGPHFHVFFVRALCAGSHGRDERAH